MHGKEHIFITKANENLYKELRGFNDCRYYKDCQMIVIGKKIDNRANKSVAIVAGGTSDLPIAEEAAITCRELGDTVFRVYDVGAAGIHRLFPHIDTIRSADVVIAIAGMDGILPTIISSLTSTLVIAVPTSIGYGTGIQGLAALMSMLNSCSPGIVVVNIDNGFGAGIAAHLTNQK
jgi:NCAIR mutase (PurE)-related protein